MADIRKRVSDRTGVIKYEARWRFEDEHGRPQRRGKTFKTQGKAKQFLSAMNSELHLGTHVDPRSGAVPFWQVADDWQASTRWHRLKPTTEARYRSVLRIHLLPRWGDRPVNSITRGAVDAWVAELINSGMSPGTIQKVHSVFRTALSYAVFAGRLNANPAVGVSLPRIPYREMLYLDADQVNALANTVPRRYRAVVLLAAYGGLRAGELWGLKRRRLNTLSGKLTIAETLVAVDGKGLQFTTPKTHEQRTIDLPPFLCKELDAHLRTFTEGGTGPEDVVFTTPSGALQAESRFMRDVFKPAVRAVLSPEKHKLRVHDMRHTCAALLIETGAHPLLISKYLGHSSIKITMDRYGHLLPSQHEAAMRGLEDAHGAAQPNATAD